MERPTWQPPGLLHIDVSSFLRDYVKLPFRLFFSLPPCYKRTLQPGASVCLPKAQASDAYIIQPRSRRVLSYDVHLDKRLTRRMERLDLMIPIRHV